MILYHIINYTIVYPITSTNTLLAAGAEQQAVREHDRRKPSRFRHANASMELRIRSVLRWPNASELSFASLTPLYIWVGKMSTQQFSAAEAQVDHTEGAEQDDADLDSIITLPPFPPACCPGTTCRLPSSKAGSRISASCSEVRVRPEALKCSRTSSVLRRH